MKSLRGLLAFAAGTALAIYLVWMWSGAYRCAQRGGIPVLLPTGTQCAAKFQ